MKIPVRVFACGATSVRMMVMARPGQRFSTLRAALGALVVAVVAVVALLVSGGTRHARLIAGRMAAADSSVVYEWGQFGGGQPDRRRDRRGPLAPRARGGSPEGIGPVQDAPVIVRGLHGQIVQIATSNSDSYALTRSGAVYAWGPGGQGELGDGVRVRYSPVAVRVRFPAGVRIASLPNPMPYDGGMAISTTGTVWGWGNNRSDDFCQGTRSILLSPVRVPLPGVTLAVGALRHAIYDSEGRVVSCGAGQLGQLGDGTRGPLARSDRPVAVRGLPGGTAIALTSAWGNAGVLMAEGAYYDWGYNRGGQVGDGTHRPATTAVRVALPHPVRSVFAGGSYGDNGQTVALLSDGSLWEWGSGRFGQLGNGTRHGSRSPIRLSTPSGGAYVSVGSGGSTSYAISAAGRLWAWGNNRLGQLGTGSAARLSTVPVEVPVVVSEISSTAHNVAALGAPTLDQPLH